MGGQETGRLLFMQGQHGVRHFASPAVHQLGHSGSECIRRALCDARDQGVLLFI